MNPFWSRYRKKTGKVLQGTKVGSFFLSRLTERRGDSGSITTPMCIAATANRSGAVTALVMVEKFYEEFRTEMGLPVDWVRQYNVPEVRI